MKRGQLAKRIYNVFRAIRIRFKGVYGITLPTANLRGALFACNHIFILLIYGL